MTPEVQQELSKLIFAAKKAGEMMVPSDFQNQDQYEGFMMGVDAVTSALVGSLVRRVVGGTFSGNKESGTEQG